jgi:hypothetical protein
LSHLICNVDRTSVRRIIPLASPDLKWFASTSDWAGSLAVASSGQVAIVGHPIDKQSVLSSGKVSEIRHIGRLCWLARRVH